MISAPSGAFENRADGSVIVVATDAPVDARNLKRMAVRAVVALARTGSAMSNGSGDYCIAFSTAPDSRVRPARNQSELYALRETRLLANDAVSPLFLAVIEATEEAVYNSLFRRRPRQARGTVEALGCFAL